MNTPVPPSRLRQFVATLPGRLRHPTFRGIAWGLASLPVLALIYVLALIPFTPSIADLREIKSAKPSVILSADGMELADFKRANRDWVKLGEISPSVIAALIATEDHRFYEHRGMDLRRTASAVLHTFKGNLQGGSTITQQLARNLYPEEVGRSRTLTRKIKEAITALKIEAVYSKDEILETYLNTVPFLYNAYGIEMAARTYFDSSADALNVLQSATLIGMLKGTSYYNPVLNPERALRRRNIVLTQMVKHQHLPSQELAALKAMPLQVDFERQDAELGPAPHFTQQLRRWVIEWADRNDYNIYADGLVVRTTIDSRLQAMANEALTRQADKLQAVADADPRLVSGWKAGTSAKPGGKIPPRAVKPSPAQELVLTFVRDSTEYKAAIAGGQTPDQALARLQADPAFMQALREDKTRLQAGFLALNPANGHVMAWVGSRDFKQDQFDHVAQARRQPGSTFKPFVYGAAFENGSRPSDGFMDEAVEIPMGDGTFWRPSDGSGPSGALMTLRDGLVYSKNTITAQVMQVVGPTKVAKLATLMGVRQSKLDEVLSLALGTSPVSLKEMVASYSTLVNEGRYIEPMVVTAVEDRNGVVLEDFQPKVAEAAMSTLTAQLLVDVMRGVVDQGTGAGIRSRFGIKADVAGKTGTTQDNTDGWFILMHPQLVAGAWVGFNDNRVTMGDRWGPGAQSALPVVGEFYQQALKARVIDQRSKFTATPGLSKQGPPQPELNPLASAEPLPGTELAGSSAQEAMASRPPASGLMSPPPVKYVNVQILPSGVQVQRELPQIVVVPGEAAAAQEPYANRRAERTEAPLPPNFPLSEVPAPGGASAR